VKLLYSCLDGDGSHPRRWCVLGGLVAWWLGEMGTFVAGPQATKGVFLRKAVIAWVMHAKLVLYFHCTIGRGRMGENEEEEDDGGGTGARLLAESTIHVIVTRPSILLPHIIYG